jgi:urease accessory protein
MAALKAVPLGQTAGQKILLSLGSRLEALADLELEQSQWSNLAPGLACLSARHETQYSRLFRS